MTKVVVTDHAFGGADAEAAVAHRFGAEFSIRQCRTEAGTVEAVVGADVALYNRDTITRAVWVPKALSTMHDLQVVHHPDHHKASSRT